MHCCSSPIGRAVVGIVTRVPNNSVSRRPGKRINSSARRTWMGQFLCLADQHVSRSSSSAKKQVLRQPGLGLKKINFFSDDDEKDVLEKITSEVLDENGVPMGFPRLREGKEFEIISRSSNFRNLSVVKISWAVKNLKKEITN